MKGRTASAGKVRQHGLVGCRELGRRKARGRLGFRLASSHRYGRVIIAGLRFGISGGEKKGETIAVRMNMEFE